jgi:protein SCO1/2
MKTSFCLIAICLLTVACDPSESGSPTLPYLGPFQIEYNELDNGKVVADTSFHTIPEWMFVNQHGTPVGTGQYFGHVYVADFFFTNCPTICPIMTSQMSRLHDMLAAETLVGEVKLLSHTVDPKRDEPARLLEYMEMVGVKSDDWHFVTGYPEELDIQTREGYLVTAFESDSAAGGFFHTDQFVLIDQIGHIRGYYDGTSTTEVNQLFEDIKILVNE